MVEVMMNRPEEGKNENDKTEKIETRYYDYREINYKGRKIALRGIDHLCFYFEHLRDRIPQNWQKEVAKDIADSSLTFVEYFPPELRQTLVYWPLDGRKLPPPLNEYQDWFKDWFELRINPLFGKIEKIAAEQGKNIAVADIINKELASLWYIIFSEGIGGIFGKSLMSHQKKFNPEKFNPEENRWFNIDYAKRVFTAKAIIQEAERHNIGSTITYIAPPAHTIRVGHYIEDGPSSHSGIIRTVKATFPKLDYATRIWKPTFSLKTGEFDGWTKFSETPVK